MRFLPILFSTTLFLSAFLSFSVQPILGKMLLPVVGGAPAGWVVAMAFFQSALLVGYGLSAVFSRMGPWSHATGVIALWVVGWLFLPVTVGHDGASSPLGVMRVLSHAVFVPFVALTATTSALVRLFSATRHGSAHDPHYLFAASNAGSFVGLFLFPFYLEPRVGLSLLTVYWHVLYGVALMTVACCVYAAWCMRAHAGLSATMNSIRPATRTVMTWFWNAFVACSLSLGVTTMITTDIGGFPLFWVLPLGLYLITFMLAFARRTVVHAALLNYMHVAAVVFTMLVFGAGRGFQPGGAWLQFMMIIAAILALFFVVSWACHRRVADTRPQGGDAAFYYFILALGGAAAGFVHVFILPFVLPDIVEFPLVMLGSLLLNPLFYDAVRVPKLQRHRVAFFALAGIAAVAIVAAWLSKDAAVSRGYFTALLFVFCFCYLVLTVHPRLVLVVGCVTFLTVYPMRYAGDIVDRGRNFFGAYAVFDLEKMGHTLRYFTHGNTVHGIAMTDPVKPDQSYYIGYYARQNPIHDTLRAVNAKTWAVVGLGAGQLACYDRAVTVDFYEIDADVVTLARSHFPYLNQCAPRDIVLGDGRLALSASDKTYDVILLDAFTSDGVPAHLLTREAVRIYRDRLAKGGIILFHISNRYLNLARVLAAVGTAEGLYPMLKAHQPKGTEALFQFPSVWIALADGAQTTNNLADASWFHVRSDAEPWTDDRFSLLTAFMF